MLEARALDEFVDLAGTDGLGECRGGVGLEDLSREVPIAIEAVRVDLAEIELVEQSRESIAQDDVAVGQRLCVIGGGQRGSDCLVVEVGGNQPIFPATCDCRLQRLHCCWILPRKLETECIIELGQELLGCDAVSVDVAATGPTERFDPRAQCLFYDRIGERCGWNTGYQ